MTRDNRQAALMLIGVLIVWEMFCRFSPLGHSGVPAPSSILAQYWVDRNVYPQHLWATMKVAAMGFVAGNIVAILAAIAFCRFPILERIFRGVNVALFAMPAIVTGPVLVILFSGNLPQVILSALLVYYPTMTAMLVGLRDLDPRVVDVVSAYGGGEPALMRIVRLRSSVPSLLAGLRVAASLAVLGAILGEFGSGERWGLGSLLLRSLGEGNPARLWGIGLAAAALAMVGYGMFSWIGGRIVGSTSAVTLAADRLPGEIGGRPKYRSAQRALTLAAAIFTPFLLWQLLLQVTQLNSIIAPGPLETLGYLFVSPRAAAARAAMLAALGQTLPIAALGLISGLAMAFVLAALSVLRPRLAKAVLPIALLAQNIPLVALLPIVLLVFGRGPLASVFMAALIVFFPGYVLMAQGFALVPNAARDLVRAYGGGRLTELLIVSVPYSIRYFFAAAKLVSPQALLGVMVTEWLLTGRGLGNLLNVSRATLDYDMIWAGALISILISIAAVQGVSAVERVMSQGSNA